jgi:hypothetical protein
MACIFDSLQLGTTINWGCYAEWFAFDNDSDELYLESQEGQMCTSADRHASYSPPTASAKPEKGKNARSAAPLMMATFVLTRLMSIARFLLSSMNAKRMRAVV